MKVLFIDDEPEMLEQAKIFLERENEKLKVDTVFSPEKGLEKLTKNNYDAVVSDYKFSGLDGIELLKKVRDLGNSIPFIILTGKGSKEIKEKALQYGADDYIQKGKSPTSLYGELAEKIVGTVAGED